MDQHGDDVVHAPGLGGAADVHVDRLGAPGVELVQGILVVLLFLIVLILQGMDDMNLLKELICYWMEQSVWRKKPTRNGSHWLLHHLNAMQP